MSSAYILIIDDDPDIQEVVKCYLQQENYTVGCSSSGEDGIRMAKMRRPDLILLDYLLPGMNGLQVCEKLKKDLLTRDIPVVMLTVRNEESDIVAGYDSGAMQYIVKPFRPAILVAKIKASLRLQRPAQSSDLEEVKFGDVRVHRGRREVFVGDRMLLLTPTEFRLLECFVANPGWVISRREIVNLVQGAGVTIASRAIDVHLVSLRKKLGESGNLIETIRGVGYKLRDSKVAQPS